MTAYPRPAGLLEWDRAWAHAEALPAPLDRLVQDALAAMIRVLMDEAGALGDEVARFDLLLFAKGAERFCRELLVQLPPEAIAAGPKLRK